MTTTYRALAAAVAALALGGTAAGCSTGATATASASHHAATSAAAKPKPKPSGPHIAPVGRSATYSDSDGTAVITPNSVAVHTGAAPGQDGFGSPPKNGEFLVVDLTVRVTKGTYSANSLYYEVQTPDGHIYSTLDGNADQSGYDPSDGGTFVGSDTPAGRMLRGLLVYDVPKASGDQLILTDPLQNPVAYWHLN